MIESMTLLFFYFILLFYSICYFIPLILSLFHPLSLFLASLYVHICLLFTFSLYFIFIPVSILLQGYSLLSIPFSLSIISLHILSNSLTFTRNTICSTPRRKLLVLLHYRHSLEELVKK